MKDVNQYQNELVGRVTAEVLLKLPDLIVNKMSRYEIAYDDKIADAMIEMYLEGLNEGVSRANEALRYATLYKATSDLLNGGNHNE